VFLHFGPPKQGAEDRETAHAAAHAFVRWMEELDVLD
jgi:hypothetical protein